MASDRDKRTDKEREIDDFLARFDNPFDELSEDTHRFLETDNTTKMTAAHTFHSGRSRAVYRDKSNPSPSLAEFESLINSAAIETPSGSNSQIDNNTSSVNDIPSSFAELLATNIASANTVQDTHSASVEPEPQEIIEAFETLSVKDDIGSPESADNDAITDQIAASDIDAALETLAADNELHTHPAPVTDIDEAIQGLSSAETQEADAAPVIAGAAVALVAADVIKSSDTAAVTDTVEATESSPDAEMIKAADVTAITDTVEATEFTANADVTDTVEAADSVANADAIETAEARPVSEDPETPAQAVLLAANADAIEAADSVSFADSVHIADVAEVPEAPAPAEAPDAEVPAVPAAAEAPALAAKAAPAKAEPKSKSKSKAKSKAKSKNKSKNAEKRTLKNALFCKKNKAYDPDSTEAYVTYKGKKVKNKPYLFSFFKLFRDFVLIGVAMVLCFMVYALSIISTAPKIDPADIYASVDTSSVIFDDEGQEIDSVYYTQNRHVVKYEEMPEHLINSFIAIEDKTFWKHHGFNWTRMIGAVLSSFRGDGRISGTSTITQQLARNVYLSDIKSQRSIRRKITEMYYAFRIERSLSKEEIIEAYLNSIYLGYGCYGVDAAARTYFSKEVKDLSLLESAALAALPQAPEDYALLKIADGTYQVAEDAKIVQKTPNTIVTNDRAKGRRDLTLGLMKDQGYITDEEYAANTEVPLSSFIKPTIKSGYGNYSYYHEYLVDTIISDLMEQYGMEYADAERTVYTKGLKIYSTMDSTAQNVVAEEFKDSSNFPSVSAIHNTDADGNMLNNDKEIALYNYRNFFDDDGNYILDSDDVSINSDGSVTIFKGHDLNIYETQVAEGTDYSLEFKNYYVVDNNQMYSIQGGYINVPSTYKSLDSSGNLVISADYFADNEGDMKKDGDKLIITDDAYSLATRTLQPQSAMVIVEVGTGEVKAMVGGRTFKGQKLLNRALNARQPGSSIKPLAVYGAALQKSYELAAEGKKWTFINFDIDKQGAKGWGDYVTVHTSIEDEKTHIENRDWPENVTRSFSGENTFKTAIQKSINTCAVKLQLQVGSDFSMQQLKKFGITTAVDDESQYANDMNPAALGLGAMVNGVEPIEMALAYASFPAGGKLNSPICYTKVLDRNGEVLLEGKSEQTDALDEGVAFIMTDVLQSVVKANRYSIQQVVHGGKTGTTNDKYDIWFDGFTPTYAAALWIGTDHNVEMSGMSYIAAGLWGKIMGQIPKACQGQYPAKPINVVKRGNEYFTAGTETGLTTYKSPERLKKEKEEKEKKRKAAYEKWLVDRESHKHKVVDKPAVYGSKLVIDQKAQDAWTETINHPAQTHQEPVLDDEGNPTGEYITIVDKEAWTETVNHPAVPEKSHYEQVVITPEVWHWEYDKGYRDGEFKYED